MSTKSNTSKANQTPKTDPASVGIDAKYAFAGPMGKNRIYLAAIEPDQPVNVGDLVRLTAQSGAVNLGRLVSVHSTGTLRKSDPADAPTYVKWLFDRVPVTAEQMAQNRVLNLQKQESYWASEAGVKTAERIKARTEAKANQTSEQTSEQAPAQVVTSELPATRFDRVALIRDLKEAGFTVAEIMAEVAKMDSEVIPAPVASVAPVQTAPVVTSKRGPIVVKAPAQTSAQVKAQGEQGSGICPSCKATSKRLYGHVAGVEVCDPCMNLSASEVTQRVAKNHLGK